MSEKNIKLVIAEKPSVAQSIAKVIGADKREDGYLEGNGYIVSWCVGHLVELASPQEAAQKWNVSLRWVQRLCKENRIEGVLNINRVWLIPKDAKKPADARCK